MIISRIFFNYITLKLFYIEQHFFYYFYFYISKSHKFSIKNIKYSLYKMYITLMLQLEKVLLTYMLICYLGAGGQLLVKANI